MEVLITSTEAIVIDPGKSTLLRRLQCILPVVLRRLGEKDAWWGFDVFDPVSKAGRARLVCVEDVFDRVHDRVYSLSAHSFTDVGTRTAMHDHRYPLAVFAFASFDDEGSGALYDMPWQRRDPAHDEGPNEGCVAVADGSAWAIIDHRRVRHAVHSRRRHCSILLADITDGPSRPDRLESRPLEKTGQRIVHMNIERSLHAALTRRSGAGSRPFSGLRGGGPEPPAGHGQEKSWGGTPRATRSLRDYGERGRRGVTNEVAPR